MGLEPSCARWTGSLHWPCSLPDAPIIDMSEVEALGSWIHDWFRQRPQRAVVAAPAAIKRQLSHARLPILWYSSLEAVPAQDLANVTRTQTGVSPDERALLWGVNDG